MYCAYITTLKGLRKHNNADRLQCVEVFGQNVIVDLSYQEGQKVVFFPSDGQLSLEYATDNNLVRKKDENGNNIGGYMDAEKRNVTAIRLRGEKSEGLVLPVETLSKYTDISKLKDGDQITVLGGHEICQKYIPRGKNRSRGNGNSSNKKNKFQKETVSYPFFEEQVNTASSDIKVQEKRRVDLVYNLADCVKQYDKHEADTLTAVADGRGSTGDIENVTTAITAVAEAYPELKSNENYKTLMNELSMTENMIAEYRSNYNKQIKEYKRYVRKFPTRQFLGLLGYEVQEYEYLDYNAPVDAPQDLFKED